MARACCKKMLSIPYCVWFFFAPNVILMDEQFQPATNAFWDTENSAILEEGEGDVSNERNEFQRTWNDSMLFYLNDIRTKSVAYRDIHEQSAIYCENRGNFFSFLLIFFSFVVTCVSGIPFEELLCNSYYRLAIAILSLITTTLATITKFLNYQEYATRHRLGSQKFLELNQTITEELIRPQFKRTKGEKFVKWASASFRSIRKGLPYPPKKIQVKYDIIEPETKVYNKTFIDECNGNEVPESDGDGAHHIVNVKENENEFNWELRRFKFNT